MAIVEPTPGMRTAYELLSRGLPVVAVRRALCDELRLSECEALQAVEAALKQNAA